MHLLAALLVLASTASGTFQADKHPPIAPKFAAAYETRDPGDARKRAIEVILTEKPIDAAAAVADLDPHTHVINQDALDGTNYILLWIRHDGGVSMNATYSETMTQFVDNASFGKMKVDLTRNAPDEVEGRIVVTREGSSADLRFSTKVTRRAAGTKLAAGGGPAGKAFLALVAAAKKKDWTAMQTLVTPATLERFDDVDDAVETLGFWIPMNRVKVTGGEQRGEEVILEAEGEIFKGQQAVYLVRMVNGRFDRAVKAGLVD